MHGNKANLKGTANPQAYPSPYFTLFSTNVVPGSYITASVVLPDASSLKLHAEAGKLLQVERRSPARHKVVLGLAGHEEDQHVLALDRHRVDKSAMRILPDQRLEEASLNFF